MNQSPHLPIISPVVPESSAWSRDPTLPALAPHSQLRKCGISPIRAQVERQQEGEGITCLQPVFSTRIRAPSHLGQVPQVCQGLFCLPQLASESSLQGHRRCWHPWAPGCQAGQSEGEEGRGLHAPLGSKTQCWRPCSDFPRNSLDQVRTTISQTLSPHQGSCLLQSSNGPPEKVGGPPCSESLS